MEMQGEDPTAVALAAWPVLAREIGLDPTRWSAHPLAARQDARVCVVLLRMTGPGAPLVLKHQARPVDPTGFLAAMEAHLAAAEVYPGGVPALHALDPEAQVCVMDLAEGQVLAACLEGAPLATQAELLRRVGQWLDGFHRALPGESRVFQPKFTLRYLAQILDEARDGMREIAEPEWFRACAETLLADRAAYEGQRTVTAQTHGDLHLRNLLVAPQRITGIDFAGGKVVPVGHDIARLLVDYALLHAPTGAIPPGELLPPEAQAAFFEGYTLTGPADPSVRLLLRHRLLAEWWGLPARPEARSLAQARRFAGVMALAARAFPGSA